MPFDMMSYLRNAWDWFGGGETKGGTKYEGGVQAGVGAGGGKVSPGDSVATDVLGGLVGGLDQSANWKGAGFGGVAEGKVTGKEGGWVSGHLGGGAGGGYATFDGTDSKGYHNTGGSIAAGAVAPVGVAAGKGDFSVGASTNVYTGAGGSAYEYSKDGDHGYGMKGSYVPTGLMDTDFGFKTGVVDYNAHVDNAYMNKVSADLKAGHKGDSYYIEGSGGYQTGIEGFKTTTDTPIGTFGSHGKSINYGPAITGGGSYNTKTGAVEAHGSYKDGFYGDDVGVSYKAGDFDSKVTGDFHVGNTGKGYAGYDPTTGTFKAGVDDGRTGGLSVTDVKAHAKYGDSVDIQGSLGEFSTDHKFSGYTEVDANHAKAAASWDGGGIRINDAKVNGTFGSGDHKVTTNASVGSIGSTNSFNDAYLEADWKNGAVNAGFKDLSFGGWSGKDIKAGFEGPYGIAGKAELGSFNQGLTMEGGKATIDENGLSATLAKANYDTLSLKDASYDFKLGDAYSANGKLGEFGTNHVAVNDAYGGLTKDKGLHVGAKDARYDSVYLKGLEANQSIGGDLYKSHLGLGEGSYNSFSGKNIYAGINSDGMTAKLEDGKYRYLAGKDINADISMFGGNLGVSSKIGEASVGGVDIGKLDYKSDFRNTDLSVTDLGAHGLKAKDLESKANIGALSYGGKADSVSLLDLNIGKAEAHTKNFGLEGNAAIEKANLDAVNIKGGHVGLGWDGKEFLGASGDIRSGGGVDSAKANWDILGGTADAQFKNAHVGGQLSNASVNLFGHDLALPDAGYKLNASGGANLDLSQGAASANLGLGGSSVNFAGHQLTVPEWVQAQAGVNLSQGAANVQLGGQNGIGADVNLSQGNVDLNAFGYTLDVDQGVRDVGNAIGSGARTVGNAISNGASAVGGAISSGASRVWNALPSVSLPSLW